MTQPALPPLASRRSSAHKGDFGRVLLIGGSRGMSGSISLSAMAALRSGAGLVSAAIPDRCLETVASFDPCLMTIPLQDDEYGRIHGTAVPKLAERLSVFDAIACGPGLGVHAGAVAMVEMLLQQAPPRVFDADALNVLAQEHDWLCHSHGACVLTPHPGELQRLTGVNAKTRLAQIDAAQQLAQRSHAVVVVKGGPTVVCDGNQTWTNSTGNPGMATAGCGDVLTGVIVALLGQGLNPWDAARWAVYVHGLAGDITSNQLGQTGMTARDLLERLPQAFVQAQSDHPVSRNFE